jgi:PadR family transcriptional regulator, regulatory protein PadR
VEQAQLLKGVLEIAILAVLLEGETYGYEILSRLEDAGLSGVGDASVYGTLRRLEQGRYVRSWLEPSENGPARKYYAVTEPGHDLYRAGSDVWHRIATALDHLIDGARR